MFHFSTASWLCINSKLFSVWILSLYFAEKIVWALACYYLLLTNNDGVSRLDLGFSLDCIEKSLDYWASLKITMRGTSVQKQQAVKHLLSQLEANLWSFAAVILLRNKHQHQKKFAPNFGHAKEWTSELQAHHCMTPEQWTWLLCSASVIPENTVALQKFNQSIGIELLTSCFLENLGA